jgi:hypothetical protein
MRAVWSALFFGIFIGATAPAMVYGMCWLLGMIGMHDSVVLVGLVITGIVGFIVGSLWGWAQASPKEPNN